MVSISYNIALLETRIRLLDYTNFPKTSAIRSRVEIIGLDAGLLISLKNHYYNVGDSLEILTGIWLDAANKALLFPKKSGDFFERYDCSVTQINSITRVEKKIRGSLYFRLQFVNFDDKKYLFIHKCDPTYEKFDRIQNPLTDDDLNAALLR